MVIEFFLAFWAGEPRNSVGTEPWQQHENRYEKRRGYDDVDYEKIYHSSVQPKKDAVSLLTFRLFFLFYSLTSF